MGSRRLRLVEQKRLQWNREREELNGLWTPWGRPGENSREVCVSSSYVDQFGLEAMNRNEIYAGNGSEVNNCHLPPIKSARSSYDVNSLSTARKQSIGNGSEKLNSANRKMSLPCPLDTDFAVNYLNSQNMHVKNGHVYPQWNSNEDDMFPSGHQSDSNDYNSAIAVPENCVQANNNKASVGSNINTNRSLGVKKGQNDTRYRSGQGRVRQAHFVNYKDDCIGGAGDRHVNDNYDYIVNEVTTTTTTVRSQAVPAAMRSSLTFGIRGAERSVESNRTLQEQEKRQWLDELDKQREEQRQRKLRESDESRPKWGDRGIGVGHFWEPALSANTRLPPNSAVYAEDPVWLQKSLSEQYYPANSKSQPNLHLQHVLNNEHDDFDPQKSYSQHNLHSTETNMIMESGYSETSQNCKTFLRGQNVPVDPEVLAERERKRIAALQHQDYIRKQIEERQKRLKEEKERRAAEEQDQETRMFQYKQIELRRLELESKKGNVECDNEENECSPSHSVQKQEEQKLERDPSEVWDLHEHRDQELAHRQSRNMSRSYSINNCLNCDYINTDEPYTSAAPPPLMSTSAMSASEFEKMNTPQANSGKRESREFGTQTDDGTDSKENSAKVRSTKQKPEKDIKEVAEKKPERPKWGVNPIKKVYMKQPEKDPLYQHKLRRRQERMRRLEAERTVVDTGTESEDHVHSGNINNRTIRRKSRSPPRAVVPMKAVRNKMTLDDTEFTRNPANLETRGNMRKQFARGLSCDSSTTVASQLSPSPEADDGYRTQRSGGIAFSLEQDDSRPLPRRPLLRRQSEDISIQKLNDYNRKPEKLITNTINDVKVKKSGGQKAEESRIMEDSEPSYYYTPVDDRPKSPPVPAVAKKMNMGYAPEEFDIMNDSSPELFEHVSADTDPNTVKLHSSYSTRMTRSSIPVPLPFVPVPPETASSYSSGPKVDIEIAVTPRNDSDFTISPQYGTNMDYSEYEMPFSSDGRLDSKQQLIRHVLENDDLKTEMRTRNHELKENGMIAFNMRIPSRGETKFSEEEPIPNRNTLFQQRRTSNYNTKTEWLKGRGNSCPNVLGNLSQLRKTLYEEEQRRNQRRTIKQESDTDNLSSSICELDN